MLGGMERSFTKFEAGERTYPALSPHLKAKLDEIVPSQSGTLSYFPCRVTLKDGTIIDRVYIVEAQPYITVWGVWPDQDAHKYEVRLEEISEVQESPSRLPARFANKLYRAGESGMGYTVFTVRFRDGAEMAYVSGGAVDFISFPAGQSQADIVDVSPHIGRDRAVHSDIPYFWCLHGYGKSRITFQQWQQ